MHNSILAAGMKKKIYKIPALIFLTFGIAFNVYFSAAQDSSHIRISLLTCTPGEELYSTFGHTAIRITDSNSVNDIVLLPGHFDHKIVSI